MSAKQREITLFFQNKKQKTNDNFDENPADIGILSTNSNETQDETKMSTELPQSEIPQTSSPASPQITSPTTPKNSSIAIPQTLSSASPQVTLPATPKIKCEYIYCASDHPFVPQNKSDLKSSDGKRNCQVEWFMKNKCLSYCQVRNKKQF
jgi:cytoskeletal protein RodZ